MNPSNPDVPIVLSTVAFPPPDNAGYAASDGQPADGRVDTEEEMGRKRTKAAGRYKPESSWRLNRTVFNPGVTAPGAGTILYKGRDVGSGQHKFLLRHQWFVGTARKTASKQIKAPNASDAERQLYAWVQQVRNGRILPRVPGTFADYVEGVWFPQRLHRVAGSTMKAERGVWEIRIKPFLGDLRIDQLSQDVLRDWVATNGSSPVLRREIRRRDGTIVEREVRLSAKPRTVKNAKAVLTTIMNDIVESGYLIQSAMPRPPRRMSRKENVQVAGTPLLAEEEYWTRDEIAAFWTKGLPVVMGGEELRYPCIRTLRERQRGRTEPRFDRMDPYAAMTTFLFGAFGLAFGTRPGETCAVRWVDLKRVDDGWLLDVSAAIGVPDADKLALADCPRWDRTLTKTGARASVSDNSGFVERFLLPFRAVQERLTAEGKLVNPNGYIFVRSNGEFCNPDLMRDRWRNLLAGLGLRAITPYGLRHTHATLLLEDGVSINAISARLRHADVTVTAKVYAHVTARLTQRTAGRVTAAGLVPTESKTGRLGSEESIGSLIQPSDAQEPANVNPDRVVSLQDWRRRKRA